MNVTMRSVSAAARLLARRNSRSSCRPQPQLSFIEQPLPVVPNRGSSYRFLSTSTPATSSSAITPATAGGGEGDSNLPSKEYTQLIDFRIAAKVEGEESHVATIELQPGEILRAESGAMLYMTQGVVMETKMAGASAAFTRMLTGQNVFLTDFHYDGTGSTPGNTSSGTVCLGTDFPSKIMRFNLQECPNGNLICQRGAFLAGNPSVNIEMEFTKSFSAGFFGGQGFVLQKLSGEGDVLVKGGGTVVNKELKDGETLRVASGSIVAFESTIEYDVAMMPGIQNAMFGGEGLFVTTLKGPGKAWLQGMPADRMIAEIARRIPGPGIGMGMPIPMGMGGGGADAGGVAAGAGADEAASGAGAEAGADATSSSGEGMVDPTDAAVNADRQATVASSGVSSPDSVEADSPSALFGDAASEDTGMSPSPDSNKMDDDSSFATESTEPTFTDDDFSSSSSSSQGETAFEDDAFKDEFSDNESFQDGGLFDDTTTSTEGFESGGADEEGSGMLRMLWDFVTGNDD
jgi:uncharacterized protein (TIGR00266 family)